MDRDIWDEIALRWKLSPQIKSVAEGILYRCPDLEIAGTLKISPSTVRTYIGRLFVAADTDDRLHFALEAWRMEKVILKEREEDGGDESLSGKE